MASVKKLNTKSLVLAATLSALIIVMTIVPYTGYIYYGLIEITTLHIVVAIGAVMLGWKYGAWLGFVWGATCLIRAFTNPLWVAFTNPLISLVPRIIVGAVTGLVAQGLRKGNCKSVVVGSVSAAVGTLTNTVLVLTALKLFSALIAGNLIETIYLTIIGVNGLIELIAAIIIVPAVLAVIQPRELVLGIDFGTSSTKIALVQNRKPIRTIKIEKNESLEEAIEKIGGSAAARIAITGVGSSEFSDNIKGIPVKKVDEFQAVSRGACRCAHRYNCLVASIGTGTSFVRITPFSAKHFGGTGLGGGTLRSLAEKLCGITDMEDFKRAASNGKLENIDLQLQDICSGEVPDLMPTSTVSNMYKFNADPSVNDVAAGICNLIFESIGVMAAFCVKSCLTRTIVMVGTISDWPVSRQSLDEVSSLHHVAFIVPDHAAFATAIGATLID